MVTTGTRRKKPRSRSYGLIDYVKVSRELTPSYDLEVYVNGETVVAEHVGDTSARAKFLLNRKGWRSAPPITFAS